MQKKAWEVEWVLILVGEVRIQLQALYSSGALLSLDAQRHLTRFSGWLLASGLLADLPALF